MDNPCEVRWLGRIAFEEARQLQEQIAGDLAAGKRPPALLLLEHPPTFTFGRRGRQEHLLWKGDELSSRGVAVVWTDRGGDVTFHGPGQLVGYPIFPLRSLGNEPPNLGEGGRLPQADYVGFLRKLEEVILLTLEEFGVGGFRMPGMTGVWVRGHQAQADRPAKIAAIGVKVDTRGITRHGFALNVDPDMSYFEGMVGCGLHGYGAASLAQILHPCPRMEIVIGAVTGSFEKVFGNELIFYQHKEIRDGDF